jgi:hypothetical protein
MMCLMRIHDVAGAPARIYRPTLAQYVDRDPPGMPRVEN